MASLDQTGYPNFPFIYNVGSSVGRGGSNAPDDVALVQWLLHRVYTDSSLFSPPEATDIAIDGYIGPHTLRWIRAVQDDIRDLGVGCVADGRVDCAGGVRHLCANHCLAQCLLRPGEPGAV
jgi:hypothetical protein